MIVSPNKGVFFLATALMCSATLYGAELGHPPSDPLTRIFVGEPNRLTLPPGFDEPQELKPDDSRVAESPEPVPGGGQLHTASAVSPAENCQAQEKPELGTDCPTDAPANDLGTAASTSASSAARVH
jgi:hypothetical protein